VIVSVAFAPRNAHVLSEVFQQFSDQFFTWQIKTEIHFCSPLWYLVFNVHYMLCEVMVKVVSLFM
jgi:hypothetical protein